MGDGTSGYVELEQAYVEYDLTGSTSISAGLFLIPIGLLNQTHEPDTFYGVERNDVEKNYRFEWRKQDRVVELLGHTDLKSMTRSRNVYLNPSLVYDSKISPLPQDESGLYKQLSQCTYEAQ